MRNENEMVKERKKSWNEVHFGLSFELDSEIQFIAKKKRL